MKKDKQRVVWPSLAHGLMTRRIFFLMLDMSDLCWNKRLNLGFLSTPDSRGREYQAKLQRE